MALFTTLIPLMFEMNNESIRLVKFKVKVLELSHLIPILPVKM